MSESLLQKLSNALQNISGLETLDARFRALFGLKGLASAAQKDKSNDDRVKQIIDIIDHAFTDNDSALLKHELAYVLGQIQDEQAINCLERVLRDEHEHPMVRHEAAEAMGAISSIKALPILQHYLTDSNVSVRETCELALRKIQFDHAIGSSGQATPSSANDKESEGAALARAKAAVGDAPVENGLFEATSDDLDSAFLPIDPAPAHSFKADVLLESIPKYEAQLTAGDALPLFERYRAMFSLRNAVHAARRRAQLPEISVAQQQAYSDQASKAVRALTAGLTDKSALFRHEICFVFGELAHSACVDSMVRVLSDDAEEEMVRHEAAEALGAVVEEAEDSAAEAKLNLVMTTLRRWADDESAPRVVRESCIVALDEMAYNNDPSQFQPVQ